MLQADAEAPGLGYFVPDREFLLDLDAQLPDTKSGMEIQYSAGKAGYRLCIRPVGGRLRIPELHLKSPSPLPPAQDELPEPH